MKEPTLHIKIKKILFAFVVVVLFLPMIQQITNFVELKPLDGSFTKLENPSFSLDNWLEGKYQVEQQDYLDQNIGFRPFFVRLYNQMHYSFFNQARAKYVIVGKENYLYEENYIKAHLGRDFIGYDKIEEKITKLQKLKDTLQTKGIDLIVVLAPGKGSFYSEFIPEEYEPHKKSTTNYEVYREKLSKSSIKLLDFKSWFSKQKKTSAYPLFPRTGIHWSKYGEMLAADSIIKYITSLSGNARMPQLIIGKVEHSNIMRDTDDDVEKGMNLLFDIKDLKMGYPQFKMQKYTSKDVPKVLTVADSYYWGMFNWGLSRDGFNEGQFWFYNEQIYPDSYKNPINVKDIDIQEEVEKNDVILLISTDANLYKFAFGFIDQLYDSYFNSKLDTLDIRNKK